MTLGIPQRDSEHYSKLQIPKHIFWKNTIILNKWRWFQIIEFYSEVTPEHCHIPNIFVCLKTSEVVWRIPNMSNFGMRCNTGSRRTYLHMYRGTWFLYKSHLTFRRLKKKDNDSPDSKRHIPLHTTMLYENDTRLKGNHMDNKPMWSTWNGHWTVF